MTAKKLLFLFILDFCLAILIGVVLLFPFFFFVRGTDYELLFGVLFTQVGIILVCIRRYHKLKKAGITVPPFFEGPTALAIRWGLITGIVLFVLNVLHGFTLESLTGIDLAEKNPWTDLQDYSGFACAGTFLAGGVMAPIVEEFFLRGLVFGAFVAAGYFNLGVIFSTLIFVGLHLDPINTIAYSMLGLGFLWVYHRTRNLWAPIIAHAINNVVGFIMIMIP